MSRPAELPEHDRSHLDELLAACPPLTVLAEHVRTFADRLDDLVHPEPASQQAYGQAEPARSPRP
jgi:hypothetical protein